ncbi:beta-glucosidase BglX [Yoonia sediminilitoris]|uniref:beta-glucosidase n=1 Tax=Yoonia sediminilitoris TaxID=1286148 RepID=A0A2T6KG52_9RHOB|nr:beta-glucosidase BglX [Yoonia sediminilitoris]PUB14288.1 beta-glucosidase [Yoonia sediminilitoris]RCW95219.1 beta-glucosidase [Yoonia sediminilitoris]
MSSTPLSDAEIGDRVAALMAKMTVAEKAGQLTQYFTFPGNEPALEKIETELRAGRAGSLLFVKKADEIDRLQHIAVEESRLGIPVLFGYDVIHGFRTVMPVPLAMAASWDPQVAEDAQAVAAAEARAIGLHWTFAPMVDIARDPRWGRMIEGAGEDPYLGSVIAVAQVRGFQGERIGAPGRVIAGPKHFAGYGASLGGRDYDEADLSDNELWNIHLPPFKAAIDAGAGNIMSAYMGLNGVPASGNKWLLTDVLRDTWGFDGFVVTDAGAAADLETHHYASDLEDAAVRALTAGIDMEMAPPSGSDAAYTTLPKALEGGRITEGQLDTAVRRVLMIKFRMGLFDNPYVDQGEALRILDTPAHRDVARRAAERSAVLLRNEGDLLPLSRDIGSIAVIGPFADAARDTSGPWIFEQDDSETVTMLAGIRDAVGNGTRVDHAPGVTVPKRLHQSIFENPFTVQAPRPELDDDAEIARAVKMANEAEVAVLVLGEAEIMIGENASRDTLDLPGRQQELLEAVLATGTPTVLLIMTGRPVDLKGAQTDASLMIWYPGTRGGEAVANLLFGDAVPGGKLPYNWPRNIGQVPLPYAHLRSFKPQEAEMRYWNNPNTPLYPFGYGLSYTTFAYDNLRLSADGMAVGDTLQVSVDVSNTGDVDADEVVQLYIHQRFGTSARPVKELKGFRRVTIAAGATETVSLTLGPDELRYWSAATRDWVQDASAFDVFVGGNSTDVLATRFTVSGWGCSPRL